MYLDPNVWVTDPRFVYWRAQETDYENWICWAPPDTIVYSKRNVEGLVDIENDGKRSVGVHGVALKQA